MKQNLSIHCTIASLFVAATAMSFAQEKPSNPNRLSLNYRAGFNIKAKFGTPANFAVTAPPLLGSGGTGNPVAREYEDGYVRVDSSGNALGLTVNWGYNNANQLRDVGSPSGGFVLMHSTVSSAGAGVFDRTENPQHGFELLYQRELLRHGSWRAGFEVAFNYTRIDIGASGATAVTLTRIEDAFPLGGIIPPVAPYAGPYQDDGWVPRIGDQPTSRTTQTDTGTVANWRRLYGSLYGFRLGPYGELSLGKGVSFLVSGGFAGGYLDGEFSYRDTVSWSGAQSGRGTQGEFMVGAYAGAMLDVALGKSWSVFVGAQWQYLEDWTQRLNGRDVKLDAGNSVFVSGGIGWSF